MDNSDKGMIIYLVGLFLICLSAFLFFMMNLSIIIMLLVFGLGAILFLFGLWQYIAYV